MMKFMIFASMALLPLFAGAQPMTGMDPNAFAKMEEMAKCMEKIDQSQVKKLEAKSNEFEAKIKALCAAGKRDQAQSQGMKFAKEMSSDPVLKQITKCGEIVKGMMPEMSFSYDEKELASKHICDDMK